MSAERMIQAAIARADLWICDWAMVFDLAARILLIYMLAGYFIQNRRWWK